MASAPSGRPLAGALIIGAALLVGLLLREPLLAALAGIFGGILATLIGWQAYFQGERRAASPPPRSERGESVGEIIAPLSDPILLLRSGRIVAANPSARRLLGEWIEGQDVRLALRHPATVERLTGRQRGAGEVERLEVVGISHAERKWMVTIAGLESGNQLVHLSDRSEAAAAEKMRVDFVANASHELRTPLAIVLGFIETLQDDAAGSDADVRARFLGLMHGEGKRMQQLIEDLMSLSRIESERFSPPREPIDLLPLVEEVRTACGQLLVERRNRLLVEDRSGGATVPGDRGQLLQLIRNLVVNAITYGRADSDVALTFESEEPDSVRLTVSDCGEGIAAVHIPRLTERFYRVDAGRSRSLGGTGLGLAIVKHIVGRHRGRLDIRSTPGEGTSIAIILPRFPEAQSG